MQGNENKHKNVGQIDKYLASLKVFLFNVTCVKHLLFYYDFR